MSKQARARGPSSSRPLCDCRFGRAAAASVTVRPRHRYQRSDGAALTRRRRCRRPGAPARPARALNGPTRHGNGVAVGGGCAHATARRRLAGAVRGGHRRSGGDGMPHGRHHWAVTRLCAARAAHRAAPRSAAARATGDRAPGLCDHRRRGRLGATPAPRQWSLSCFARKLDLGASASGAKSLFH